MVNCRQITSIKNETLYINILSGCAGCFTRIGDDNFLMMDANQKWDVPEAIENMKKLAQYKPLWIEEPTNCDDVVGHRQIAEAIRPLGVGHLEM